MFMQLNPYIRMPFDPASKLYLHPLLSRNPCLHTEARAHEHIGPLEFVRLSAHRGEVLHEGVQSIPHHLRARGVHTRAPVSNTDRDLSRYL